ncbi:MAG TPA: DUF2182 domain-containing protein [Gemmatimonas sp.]|nr:DUF2182 domain-containing protein [Gemmatimonas sp.]
MTESHPTSASPPRGVRLLAGAGTRNVVALMLLAAAISWWLVVRDSAAMVMPTAVASLPEAARYTIQWGVMMTAMMLPAAAPLILLYGTVSRRLSASGDKVISPSAFAAVYLLVWTLPGVPLYLAHVAIRGAAARWPAVETLSPYGVAAVLGIAGAYQFSNAKAACLRYCESPFGFLMKRWRSGYDATLRLALAHAGYCLGCCWGLMAILVVAGAMSLHWVLAITIAVSAEKLFPKGGRTSRFVGAVLVALAVAIAINPEIAAHMDGGMRHEVRDDVHDGMVM